MGGGYLIKVYMMPYDKANENRVLPNSSEASKIVQNWSSLNNAFLAFGGETFDGTNYWTSSQLRQYYYYFNSSGVGTVTDSSTKYSVRTIFRH